MPELSIIIPAYNVERYITTCLESLLPVTQQGHDVELIVVNDGSTDGTLRKVEAFRSEKCASLRIIDQVNGGLGNARNSGLDVAQGRYVWFVDGDDRLLPDALLPWEYMDDALPTDIISIEMVQGEENVCGESAKLKPYRRYTPDYGVRYSPARNFLRGRNLMPCAVAYILRRDFLMAHGLRFREGIYHEDEDFSIRLFLSASSFIASPNKVYEYIMHPKTITTDTDTNKCRKRLRDIISIISEVQRLPHADDARYKIDYLAVDTLRLLIRQHHDKAFRKEIIASLRSLGLFPLRWHWEWKYILFRLIWLCLIRNINK